MNFGQWLKKRINRLPMEANEFARAADIPIPTLKKWLGQERPKVRPANRMRLAKAIKVPVEEIDRLLDGDERPPAPSSTIDKENFISDQVVLSVPISQNDLAFLAPRYPGRAVVEWASSVLAKEIARMRSSGN